MSVDPYVVWVAATLAYLLAGKLIWGKFIRLNGDVNPLVATDTYGAFDPVQQASFNLFKGAFYLTWPIWVSLRIFSSLRHTRVASQP